ncbi:histone-fold-containing protein [Lactarius hatsudake]|nr:histone-fold-containing protein [Lactarius hatsudake]
MKNRNKTTKFPVARIKKIMQKDEEVGKVAQATPIVISKALELFLQLVVDEASRVTASRGSKKVEAYHLKHAIETTEMLDFLKELVEGVPDPSAGGTIPFDVPGDGDPTSSRRKGKKVVVDDGDEDGAAPAPAKKRRRKKKVEAREPDSGGPAAMTDGDEAMQDVAPPNRGDENWDDDETGEYR